MLGGRDALESSGLSGRDYKGLLSGIQEVRNRRAAARGMGGMGGMSGDGSTSTSTSAGTFGAPTVSGAVASTRDASEGSFVTTDDGSFVTTDDGRGDGTPAMEGPVVIDLTDD